MAKSAPVPDPLNSVATSIRERLEQRSRANSEWLKWADLTAQIPDLTRESGQEAIVAARPRGSILETLPNEPETHLILKSEIGAYAESEALLRMLIARNSSAAAPVVSLDALALPLAPLVRKRFVEKWSKSANWPAGLRLHRADRKARRSIQIHDQRFPLLSTVLSEQLVAAIQQALANSSEPGMITWKELLTRIVPTPDADLLRDAIHEEPFRSQVTLLRPELPNPWMTMSADAKRIIRSERFLERLLHKSATLERPAPLLSDLARQVAPALTEQFLKHWTAQAEREQTFAFGRFERVGQATPAKYRLRDVRYKSPSTMLSEKLLNSLMRQQQSEPGYPRPLSQLLRETDPTAARVLIDQALVSEPFVSTAIVAVRGTDHSPVALESDSRMLIESPWLLPALLERMTTATQQAFRIEQICRPKVLQSTLIDPVRQQLQTLVEIGPLPEGVGLLISRGEPLFFLSRSVRTGTANSTS